MKYKTHVGNIKQTPDNRVKVVTQEEILSESLYSYHSLIGEEKKFASSAELKTGFVWWVSFEQSEDVLEIVQVF